MIGHKEAPLKRVVPGSVEWAQLEEAPGCGVREFIESLDGQDQGNIQAKMLVTSVQKKLVNLLL